MKIKSMSPSRFERSHPDSILLFYSIQDEFSKYLMILSPHHRYLASSFQTKHEKV